MSTTYEEDTYRQSILPEERRLKRIQELAYYKWIDAGCPNDQESERKFYYEAKAEYEAAERLIIGL
jgi:hypothetical protein